MATKKTYYIEFGDGKGWWGTQEVGNDMRYSNMLQEGGAIESEEHALISHLGLSQGEHVTVRKTTEADLGFSSVAGQHTLAIMCVRVWCDEEEIEEDEEE